MDMELAYLAGFFDGEGSICERQNGAWPTVRVQASQLDPVPIQMLHRRYGGHIKHVDRSKYNPNAHWIWEWVVSAALARKALYELLPLLRVKRDEAEAALAYGQHLSSGPRGRPLDTDKAAERQQILNKWREVRQNRRNPV